MTTYYERGGVTILHADCRDALALMADCSADLVLTDPPYSEETHAGARTGDVDVKLVEFASVTADELRDYYTHIARVARRWVVSFMDWRHIAEFERNPPAGLRFVRFGVWVKPNGAPQFTGDRPSTGWEGICFMARAGIRLEWNGGGRSSVFRCNKVNSEHPTGKPEPLMRELVSLFSRPGDLVVDPFMGSGTTARACKDLGRRFVGCEIEERWCQVAVRRLAQEVLPLEMPA